MMLARLGFMTRAYKARVGPLETISLIPIWSFLMRSPAQAVQWVLYRSRHVSSASRKSANGRIHTQAAGAGGVAYANAHGERINRRTHCQLYCSESAKPGRCWVILRF